jgi:ADP-ribose pyrophosphatase
MSGEWTVKARRSLLNRPPWFEVFQEEIQLPDGQLVDDFYTIAIPEFVVVAGFDTKGNVLLERSYRRGASAVTWSLPSGYIDPGEDALGAAKRELLEETGYQALTWRLLGRFAVDGNRGCGWANVFIAGEIQRLAEPNSLDLADVEIHLLPYAQSVAKLLDGGVAELATAAAIGMAALSRAGMEGAQETVSIADGLPRSDNVP